MKTYIFDVPGQPVPWARAGTNGKRRYTPERQRMYMAAVRQACADKMRGAAPLDGPVEMYVHAHFEWPKSWPEKRRSAPGAHLKTSKPDADNIVKLVKDALNSVAYRDDAQVCIQTVTKKYSDYPGLNVQLYSLKGTP